MTRLARPLSGLILALVLALTSLSMAVARADMAMGGTMVLCLDGQQVAVAMGPDGAPLLDAAGDPVGHGDHPCPDCVIGALALAPVAPGDAGRAETFLLLDETPYAAAATPVRLQGGQGRGPPARA